MRKMLSAVTLYAVVISCCALVAGKALTPENEGSHRRKSTKHDGPGSKDKHEPYFALYDPEHNVTKKYSVTSWLSGGYWPNFIARDALPDKEQETRIHFNGLTAKETKVDGMFDPITGEKQGLKLRQLTDGIHFIQLIYDANDNIQDCDFVKNAEHVNQFLNSFQSDIKKVKKTPTKTEEHNYEEDEGEIQSYLQVNQTLDEEFAEDFRNVTFQEISQLPHEIAEWMEFSKLRQECKENHKVVKKMLHYKHNGNETEKQWANDHFQRAKRQVTMIAPGTKWCGRDHIADTYTEVGGFSKTDKCCRNHDHCKVAIPSFTTKYGYFNYRPFTLSHCRCDRSFRACLKMARTGAANLVGKLFFNIVQTQCFVIKPEKVCKTYSWWECKKYHYKKKAYLKPNLSY